MCGNETIVSIGMRYYSPMLGTVLSFLVDYYVSKLYQYGLDVDVEQL